MNTPASSLAAFCSHGNQYKRFRTDAERIQSDVEHLLSSYGAPADVRAKVIALLQSPETHYASGFRFESTHDYHDPQRTVVYASIPIPMVDGELPPAYEEQKESVAVPAAHREGAWRRSA
jgi:hypothetical protein